MQDSIKACARLEVKHLRPYDYDEKSGLWLYREIHREEAYNLVSDTGRVQLHTFCYGTASRANGFNFIALSNDGTAPAVGDTTLTGELSGNVLTRAQGKVTLPTGNGTVTTIARTFTYTGASQQVQKTALFDLVALGVMNHEILFTPRTLLLNDQLAMTFSVTLS